MPPAVYAFGSNGSGQLALGHRDDVSTPTRCRFHDEQPPSDTRPVSIVAGGNHTLLWYSNGAVYAVGQNDDGRCGLPALKHAGEENEAGVEDTCYTEFRRVRFNAVTGETHDTFASISATWSASFFLTEQGAVFAAGTGFKGELGLGRAGDATITVAPYPQQVRIPSLQGNAVDRLVSGVNHTIVVSSNGVFGWGSARHGELGEPLVPYIDSPRPLAAMDTRNEVDIVCGLNFTYMLSKAVSDEHNSVTHVAKHILLGPSARHPLRTNMPPAARLEDYKSVCASWNTVYVLTRKGRVINWGRGERGQLAPGSLAQGGHGGIQELIAGSEHVLALGSDGTVRAWGWGEHGNIGNHRGETRLKHDADDTSNALVNAGDGFDSNEIEVTGASGCTPFGAGCATTWVLVDE